MTEEPRKTRQTSKTKEGESRLVEGPTTKEKSATPKKLTKKQLEQSLKDAQAQVEKHKSQLAYLQADHENYVKSMERREANLRLQANRDLLLSLLPILDDMERAQLMVPQIEVNEPFIKGYSMLVENLKSALNQAGVKQINCEGERFDPLRHEAVVREESTSVPPNTILEELRKGYLLKGALLRAAMVKIAVPPPKAESEKDSATKRKEK
jgi:molecular chaperone GrpE